MDNKILYTLIVHSENFAGLLNQVTAVFTRRQINIESLNVSASSIAGVHKYTITCWSTPDVIEKVARQIEKKIDVIHAHYFTDTEIFQREVAMYKVSTSAFQHEQEASRTVRRYGAHIVEVNPTFSVIELTGSSDEISGLYSDLKQLGCILQFVRSGRIAVETSCVERVNDYLTSRTQRMSADVSSPCTCTADLK